MGANFRTALLTVCSVLACEPTVAAENATPPQSNCVTPFRATPEEVKSTLEEVGAKGIEVVKLSGKDDATSVRFAYDGVAYSVVVFLCNGPGESSDLSGCSGLLFLTGLSSPEGVVFDVKGINAFNRENPVGSAVLLDNGRVAIVRFVLVKGGISKQNFVDNLDVFAILPGSLLRQFSPSASSQLEGTPLPNGQPLVFQPARFSRQLDAAEVGRIASGLLGLGAGWAKTGAKP